MSMHPTDQLRSSTGFLGATGVSPVSTDGARRFHRRPNWARTAVHFGRTLDGLSHWRDSSATQKGHSGETAGQSPFTKRTHLNVRTFEMAYLYVNPPY